MADAKKDNRKTHLRSSLGLVAYAVFVSVILLIISFGRNKPTGGQSDTTDEQTVIYDFVPIDTQRLQYAILRIDNITDEVVHLDNRDYVRVSCSNIYQCPASIYPDERFELNEIYVIRETIKELAENDVIFIQVDKRNMDGIYYYCPVVHNDQAEYISIIDDRIVLKGNESSTESFWMLFQINQRLCEHKEYYERVGKETDYSNALPKCLFEDDMTINALIDFLSQWEKAVEIREEEQRQIRVTNAVN